MHLGVEIGGTKIQAAVGAGAGALVATTGKLAVERGAGAEGILRTFAAALPEFLARHPVQSIGVGFGGPVDAARGRAVCSHQVEGWRDFPLAAWFSERFGLPTVVGNDSDLAGWAEAVHGGGRGASPTLYMNIGTGIGGALVLNGELYQGQGLGAAELGHLRMRPGEPGQPWRTLEECAAGPALDRRAREIGRADGAALAAGAREGDAECGAAWAEAVELWALALANAAALVCPRRIVVGGGVALQGETLFGPLRVAFRRQAFAPFAAAIEIVPAQLGEDMVLHGAAMLAAANYGKGQNR